MFARTREGPERAMASKINQNYFLKSLRFLLLLALTLGTRCPVTECATLLPAEVGGNVTFNCTKQTTRPIKMMYLQRAGEFINGFYSSKNISQKTWPNTRVDRQAAAVHMYNLNVSHKGDYECLLKFYDSNEVVKTEIRLQLTAHYSKPSISIHCNAENQSCLVVCTSHSGYPNATPTWNVTENNSSQWWKIVNSNVTRSQDTLLFNTSSAAVFNCSGGERKVSCSVNESTSDLFPLCAAKVEVNLIPVAIAGVVLVGILLIMGIVYLVRKKKKRSRLSQDMPRNSGELKTLNVTSPAS